MGKWRDLIAQGLGTVHKQFEIDAVYLSHAGGEPVPVKVRLHQKADQTSGYSEFDFGMGAKVTTLVDSIVFEASAVNGKVLNDAHVIFGESEAYITGAAYPVRRGFIRVEVSPMSKSDLTRLLSVVDTSTSEWAEIFPPAP
jgi:hypothetical protein